MGQLLTAHVTVSLRAVLVVSAVVAVVASAVPTRTVPGTALLAALAQLTGHAVLAGTTPGPSAGSGCLSVVSRGADLGVRYALDHGSSCPPGAVPAGPALAAVLSALAAAAAVLLASAVMATLTGVLVTTAAAGLEIVGRLAAAVLPVIAELACVRPHPAALPVPPLPEPAALSSCWRPGSVLRRGPPRGLPAPAEGILAS